MRVGVDGRKIPQAKERGPFRSLDHAVELGMEGVFFRTVLEMSPTLDPVELRELRAHADELGLYLETGLGKVNPYALAEAPEIRAAGGGDTRLGFERMLRACAAIGCTEVWIGTANYKSQYPGNFAYDRFRTDVSWAEQLRASTAFLELLAPLARELGVHMNLETHEEITSFEVVRLVEAVGPDVVGVTFDVGNVLQRGESPVRAAARVAPYVRQSHMKDVVLSFVPDGVLRQLRPCGQGVIDFEAVLRILGAHAPKLSLTIENPNERSLSTLEFFNPAWHASHADLTTAELAEYVGLVNGCQQRIASGEWPDLPSYHARAFGYAEEVAFIQASAAHLRQIVDRLGLTEPRRVGERVSPA
ncbi:MAG: sugar phosphate isomerase/epimerase [Chloroflexi bacterium]|nr:sugar phosphate isomerase/epimerase [Chloroflexota bacterium]